MPRRTRTRQMRKYNDRQRETADEALRVLEQHLHRNWRWMLRPASNQKTVAA